MICSCLCTWSRHKQHIMSFTVHSYLQRDTSQSTRNLQNPIRRHGSRELHQLMLCSWCFACAWCSGRAGLSSELGAFLAGAMVSISGAGGPVDRSHSSSTQAAAGAGLKYDPKHEGLAGSLERAITGSPGMNASHGGAGGHGHALAPEVAACRQSIDSISNILLALFLSAIGLLLAPT